MNQVDSIGDNSEALSPLEQRARRLARTLPPDLLEASFTCPLCNVQTPARGIRARPLQGVDQGQWQLVFVCPACGLITAFDAGQITPEKITFARDSQREDWWNELRSFKNAPRSILPKHVHESGLREFWGTFLLTFVTWMLLIGTFNPIDVIWGVVVSVVCARFTFRYAGISLPKGVFQPARLGALLALLGEFVRQLVVQNVSLSMRVLNPNLKIRPGIVAIPTRLRGDLPLTLVGSLSTLTPDTVVMDIDQHRGIMYVHWIDVRTTDPEAAYQLISASLEEKISRWLV